MVRQESPTTNDIKVPAFHRQLAGRFRGDRFAAAHEGGLVFVFVRRRQDFRFRRRGCLVRRRLGREEVREGLLFFDVPGGLQAQRERFSLTGRHVRKEPQIRSKLFQICFFFYVPFGSMPLYNITFILRLTLSNTECF